MGIKILNHPMFEHMQLNPLLYGILNFYIPKLKSLYPRYYPLII